MSSPEIEKSPLFHYTKWAIKEEVIAKYKSRHFEENGVEPSSQDIESLRRLLDEEELDELISSYVKSNLEELFNQAKSSEGKNIDYILGIIMTLIVSGGLWKLSERDYATAGFLAVLLFVIIIFFFKK